MGVSKFTKEYYSGHTRPVVQLTYSSCTPEGNFLVSACKDGLPMLRNADNGDWIGTFTGHKGAVWVCNLNTTATKVVTGGADYTAKVWDAVTGELKLTFTQKHIVLAASFSHDSKKIVTGGHEKFLSVYDLENPEAEPLRSSVFEGNIRVVLFSPNDKQILSAGEDNCLRIVNAETFEVEKKIACHDIVKDVELSENKKWLTVTTAHQVMFLDATTYEMFKQHDLSIEATSAALHPSKERFLVGGLDGWVHVLDFESGDELEIHKGHHGPVHSVRYHPDGKSYSSGSEDGTIRLWKDRTAFL